MASGIARARHGGNLAAAARELGQAPGALLDASASLVPFGPGPRLRLEVAAAALGWPLRAYPDRDLLGLRQRIAAHHGLDPAWVLPGNGAAELVTWAARDAAAAGVSLVPAPGFADYPRALACWGGAWEALRLPLHWGSGFPQRFPKAPQAGAALWLTNPHNPTGQLWSRASLEPLLERFALVICDEAFLPLTPPGLGEPQSLIPLLQRHPHLVVIRSLTKLHAIAGLRLGYALGHPERLRRWAGWRDPWPVNGLAAAAGEALLRHPRRARHWQRRAARWVEQEGTWLQQALAAIPGLEPLPSATNFLLVRGVGADGRCRDLGAVREALQRRQGILLRDCRSFDGLDGHWLRIGLQGRRANRRIAGALRAALSAAPAP